MEKLLIKIGRNYHFINKSEISLIKSERNYSRIYCEEKNYLVKKSLSFLENKLGPDHFLRANRSCLVNIDRINEMKDSGENEYIIVLNNKETVQWGRRYRERLVKLTRI